MQQSSQSNGSFSIFGGPHTFLSTVAYFSVHWQKTTFSPTWWTCFHATL